MTIAGVGGVDLDGEFRPGVESVFFEGKRSIAIDSDRPLRYLLWNLALKLEVISSSSSSSQIIGGISRFTPTSTLSLEDEEHGEDEGDEVDDEDGVAGGRVLTFKMGWAAGFFF